MKIIFLDIDGVLNGYRWFSNPVRRFLIKTKHLKYLDGLSQISSFRCRYLFKLLKKFPDAKVVMSSSWRYAWNRDGSLSDDKQLRQEPVDKYFRKHGLNLYGTTCVNVETNPWEKYDDIDWEICKNLVENEHKRQCNLYIPREQFLTYARGSQILSWFLENNLNPDEHEFVILEDDFMDVCCYNYLKPHTVITKFYGRNYGLRKSHYKKACEILKGKL